MERNNFYCTLVIRAVTYTTSYSSLSANSQLDTHHGHDLPLSGSYALGCKMEGGPVGQQGRGRFDRESELATLVGYERGG